MKLSDAMRALGFALEARPTLAAAREAYHALALRHHPDRGGSAEEFAELNAAWEVVEAELKKPRRCAACKGSGTVMEPRGFYAAPTRCMCCKGLGYVRDG